MTAGNDELERRVAALERTVGQESRLRASVDGDLADAVQAVKAQRHLIQAISITQTEHTQRFERIEELLLRQASALGDIAASLDALIQQGDQQ